MLDGSLVAGTLPNMLLHSPQYRLAEASSWSACRASTLHMKHLQQQQQQQVLGCTQQERCIKQGAACKGAQKAPLCLLLIGAGGVGWGGGGGGVSGLEEEPSPSLEPILP